MVFVDDAVRGTLPAICAKDGVPTTSSLTLRTELGDRAGMGVAWLLLFAGPIGWLALILISSSRGGRREVLTVELPLSERAYDRRRSAQTAQNLCLTAAVGGAVAVILALAAAGDDLLGRAALLVGIAVTVAGVIGLLVNERRVRRERVIVDLDASRRWVTLGGVHPGFVTACRAQEQRQGQRT